MPLAERESSHLCLDEDLLKKVNIVGVSVDSSLLLTVLQLRLKALWVEEKRGNSSEINRSWCILRDDGVRGEPLKL